MNEPLRVLLLAGTREARLLAERLAGDPRLAVTASLAGVTRHPAPLAVATRSGGFGGAGGLARFIAAERIDAVVDATHPFAAQMSANAAAASAAAGVPLLRLQRPQWRPGPGDTWIPARDAAEAARLIPAGARCLLTVGRKDLGAFAARTDVHFVMRMIEQPGAGAPVPAGDIIRDRPGSSAGQEERLLRDHAITVLVAKNSGGADGDAKLAAARQLALPVVMIARPGQPTGPAPDPHDGTTVETIEEAQSWLDRMAQVC